MRGGWVHGREMRPLEPYGVTSSGDLVAEFSSFPVVAGRDGSLFGLDSLVTPSHASWDPGTAYLLTVRLLHDLPARLAHSLLAGQQAQRVRGTVPRADRDVLVSAALLHDIGYSPALVQSGFHPLDGANYLLLAGAQHRLAALVAHHSESRLIAAAGGHLAELSRFRREEGPVMDALVHADMTAGPTGEPMNVPDRLADIVARHAHEDPDLLAARLARVPFLLAAAERVRVRLAMRAPTRP